MAFSKDTGRVRPSDELDWASLETWLHRHLPDLEGAMQVEQFHGGHANLTYCVSIGDTEFVVRRPPRGTIAPGAHDMAREYRVLSGLAACFDRAPRPIDYCSDDAVIGAPFIVMERRQGVVVRFEIPETLRTHANVERRISLALVDAMAELHAIVPDDVGLGKLGRPEGFLERQLSGWHQRWQLARVDGLPLFEEMHAALSASMPRTRRHCIVHNDLKLDNCMFDASNPDRVQSIFDWDMATLGDPLVELGTLLSYWRSPKDEIDRAPTIDLDMHGFPERSELVEHYRLAGFDVEGIEWYEAFALWKQAVVLQQLYRRFEKGESTDDRLAPLGNSVPALIEEARSILGA